MKIGLVGQSVAGGLIVSSPITKAVVDGKPVVGVGSVIAPHGSGPHANAVMVTGTSKFVVDGIQVCREGDVASCGHVLTLGSALSTSL